MFGVKTVRIYGSCEIQGKCGKGVGKWRWDVKDLSIPCSLHARV